MCSIMKVRTEIYCGLESLSVLNIFVVCLLLLLFSAYLHVPKNQPCKEPPHRIADLAVKHKIYFKLI